MTDVQVIGCMSSTPLTVGATRNLDANVIPSNADNTHVSWSSSDTSVATVSDTGLVTAVSEGLATITLTTEEGNRQATCAITVGSGDGGGDGPVTYGDCSATSSNGIPDPPCEFFAEVLSNNRVRLNWTDNSTNETQFTFQKFLEGDQWRGAGSSASNTTSIERGGLEADALYRFRIRATNGSGSSVWVEITEFIDLSGDGNSNNGNGSSDQFFIRNKRLDLYLRPVDANDDSDVVVETNDNSDWFKWEKIATDSGFFYLRNVQTGKYIRPIGSNDGNRLEQKPASFDGGRTQWMEVPVTNNAPFVYLFNRETQKYIRPKSTSDLRVEIRPTTYTGDWTRWEFQPVSTSLIAGLDLTKEEVTKLSFYPNPLQAGIDLNVAVPTNESFQLTVHSLSGRQILTRAFDAQNAREVSVRINTVLSKGIYLVKYSSGTRTLSGKLIVQ